VSLALSSLTPDACLGDFSWNPATIGAGESTFCGIMAGFVFAGIVAVLSLGKTDRHRDTAAALKLLFCAFLGLAATAYLLVLQSADENCLRTISEGTIFGGLLGAFVVVALVALTWLVTAYSFREDGVLRFLRHLIYVGAALVTLLLCTSSYSYLRAAVPDLPSSPVAGGVYAVGCALYALGLPVGSRPLAFMLALWGRLHGKGDRHPDQEAGAHHDGFRAVAVCAWAALGYLAVAATGGSLVIGTTDSAWDPRPLHLIYAIALSSVVAPIALLAFALHACAPEQTSSGEGADADTAPSLAREPSAD
jgi:hypothetical protein